MIHYVRPGQSFQTTIYNASPNLVGTISVLVKQGVTIVIPETTLGIVEYPASSGVYTATLTAPSTGGEYQIVWDDQAGNWAAETLLVEHSGYQMQVLIEHPDSIAMRLRDRLPMTFEAMVSASQFGGGAVRRIIDLVKYKLFATVVNPTMEAGLYGPIITQFASGMAADRLIHAAIDYWMTQRTSASTRVEIASYPDKISALWKQLEQVRGELQAEMGDWQVEMERLGYALPFLRRHGIPRVSSVEQLLTPDPQEWGALDTNVPFGQGRGYGNGRSYLTGPWRSA